MFDIVFHGVTLQLKNLTLCLLTIQEVFHVYLNKSKIIATHLVLIILHNNYFT